MILEAVLRSYRAALGRWLPLVASHLFIRLVITSLMVPVIGLLLAITLLFSDQTALTDQDIAGFLLTPAGAVGAVIILSMVLVALVLDTVVATAILRGRSRRPLEALSLAAGFTLHAVPRLLAFLSMLIGRLLVMSLPFLLVGGGIAYFFLTEHDINYYLVEKPTDFVFAAGLIGVVLLLLALLLLTRVSAWAIGLHLVMFHAVPAHRAFGISEKQMARGRARSMTERGWQGLAGDPGLRAGFVFMMGYGCWRVDHWDGGVKAGVSRPF